MNKTKNNLCQYMAYVENLTVKGWNMDGAGVTKASLVKLDAKDLKRDPDVIKLLENWYAWNRKREPNKLGYPEAAPYVRLQPQQPRKTPLPNIHEAVMIEKIVIALPNPYKHVVTVHYFYQHLPMQTRLSILARLGVPIQRACYYKYLQHAEYSVKNNLTAVDKTR